MTASERLADPTAALQHALHDATSWLGTVTIHSALGLAGGGLAARAMRRRGIHWSWAALAAGLIIAVRSPLGAAAWALALGSTSAAASMRRWHREDVIAGADLAEIAAARTSLLQLLERAARAGHPRLPAWLVGKSGADGELVLGRDADDRPVAIATGSAHGGKHALVVGATGSGKTVTQTLLAVRAIERGCAAIIVDPKGDQRMRDELRRAAVARGASFLEWTPTGPAVYNPFAHGSDGEIADKALAGERFTEPHYLRQAQRYLGHAVRALRSAGREISICELVGQLEPDRLELLTRSIAAEHADAIQDYLDGLTARQRSDLAGVRDRLAILAESDVGRWLDPNTEAVAFELLGAVQTGAVVYFALEADRRPLLAEMLGAAIVQDLLTTVAALQAEPTDTLVVLDEFSAIATGQVVRLFGRARSAGVSLLLGTQEISDLRAAGGRQLLERVLGNLSLLIAHRQVVPESAELVASLAGRIGAWRVSTHGDRVSRTRVREPLFERERIMRLASGSCAVIELDRAGGARFARVTAPAGMRAGSRP